MRIGVGRLADSELAGLAELFVGAELAAPPLASARPPALHEEGDALWYLGADVDVATACRSGALDFGIIGKEVLLEHAFDLYELLDLRVGADALVYAVAPPSPVAARRRRVATRYPRLAMRHFAVVGRGVEIVSFEEPMLATRLGIAGGVVELRRRLAGGGLEERGVVANRSLRLVVGRAAYALRAQRVIDLVERLRAQVEDS